MVLTEHMLDHIIAVLILNELIGSSVQLLQDTLSLFRGAMLENTLYHSATVGMSAQGINLAGESSDYELQCPWFDALDAFLHNVISILIFNAFQNVSVQFPDYLLLLFRSDGFQSFLNHSTAVHLQCQGQNVPPNLVKGRKEKRIGIKAVKWKRTSAFVSALIVQVESFTSQRNSQLTRKVNHHFSSDSQRTRGVKIHF